MDYKGIKCPVCDKPFTENDDIVVCPVCGAPYHRGCYKEKGACIFTDLHESGKTWAPPVPPDAPNTASELKDKECPNCGTLNAHSALFCNICGTSLTGAPDEHRNTGYNTQQITRTIRTAITITITRTAVIPRRKTTQTIRAAALAACRSRSTPWAAQIPRNLLRITSPTAT